MGELHWLVLLHGQMGTAERSEVVGRAKGGRWPTEASPLPSEARPVKPSDSEACQTLQEPPEGATQPQRARSASRGREAPQECAKRIQNARSASRIPQKHPKFRKRIPKFVKLKKNKWANGQMDTQWTLKQKPVVRSFKYLRSKWVKPEGHQHPYLFQ